MSAVTIRNLPEETHRALKLRAQKSGRSCEAEIREILQKAVAPKLRMGTALAQLGRRTRGVDPHRDTAPVDAADFE